MSKFIKVKSLYLEGKYIDGIYATCIVDEKSFDVFVNIDKIIYVGRDTTTYTELYKLDCDDAIIIISPEDYKRVIAQLDIVDDKIEDTTEPDIKTIPRGCISKRWKWVVRDKYGALYLYEDGFRPEKTEEYGIWNAKLTNGHPITSVFDEAMFKDVNWEDEEPTKIEDCEWYE